MNRIRVLNLFCAFAITKGAFDVFQNIYGSIEVALFTLSGSFCRVCIGLHLRNGFKIYLSHSYIFRRLKPLDLACAPSLAL